jgi:hypothetical protein
MSKELRLLTDAGVEAPCILVGLRILRLIDETHFTIVNQQQMKVFE